MKVKVVQTFLAILIVSLLLLSYWVATRVTERGIEERFRSAVGLNQSEEETETQGSLPIEGNNPFLYLIITLAALTIAVTAYSFARRKNGRSL